MLRGNTAALRQGRMCVFVMLLGAVVAVGAIGFVDDYLGFLAAGGSMAPAELLGSLGVDLDDPAVWEPGFAEMERMVEVAEAG